MRRWPCATTALHHIRVQLKQVFEVIHELMQSAVAPEKELAKPKVAKDRKQAGVPLF
jgi:hypothetical protein